MSIPANADIRVLITVKAAPQISTRYKDTVCVAGLYLPDDGSRPEFIRLYPVPFRYLTAEQQFRKYEVIRIHVIPSPQDGRPESRKVQFTSGSGLDHVTYLDGWRKRARIIERVARVTACGLRAGTEKSPNARSLGIVDVVPNSVDLEIRPAAPLSLGFSLLGCPRGLVNGEGAPDLEE